MGIWIEHDGECVLCDCFRKVLFGINNYSVGAYQDYSNKNGKAIVIRGLTEEKANLIYDEVLHAISNGEKLYTIREDLM